MQRLALHVIRHASLCFPAQTYNQDDNADRQATARPHPRHEFVTDASIQSPSAERSLLTV